LPAEVDHLPEEEPGHADIGNTGADLVRLAAREPGEAEGVAEPEPLVDFRIDPDLRAFPEADAGIERDVPGLPCLVRTEAVPAVVGRAERERVLPEEGGLSVQRQPIDPERCRSGAEDLVEVCRTAEAIVERELDAVKREVGGDALRGIGKLRVAVAEAAVLIFERRAPASADGDLDAGSQGPADPPEGRALGRRRAAEFAPCLLVVGPGDAAGSVEEERIEHVAEAAPYGSRRQHGVLVAYAS